MMLQMLRIAASCLSSALQMLWVNDDVMHSQTSQAHLLFPLRFPGDAVLNYYAGIWWQATLISPHGTL